MFARRPTFGSTSGPVRLCMRCINTRPSRSASRPVPPPTPFVPDTQTFLKLIGRNLSQHAAKIPSWEALFRLTPVQLRELGIEPPRARKYLLWWREKFRRGDFGIGGDMQEVTDGVAEMRVFEVPTDPALERRKASLTRSLNTRKMAINVPVGEETPRVPLAEAQPVGHVKVRHNHTICGPNVHAVKGTNGYAARVEVAEGLWEQKRGHKIDGGERRKDHVRALRRAAERKAERRV